MVDGLLEMPSVCNLRWCLRAVRCHRDRRTRGWCNRCGLANLPSIGRCTGDRGQGCRCHSSGAAIRSGGGRGRSCRAVHANLVRSIQRRETFNYNPVTDVAMDDAGRSTWKLAIEQQRMKQVVIRASTPPPHTHTHSRRDFCCFSPHTNQNYLRASRQVGNEDALEATWTAVVALDYKPAKTQGGRIVRHAVVDQNVPTATKTECFTCCLVSVVVDRARRQLQIRTRTRQCLDFFQNQKEMRTVRRQTF